MEEIQIALNNEFKLMNLCKRPGQIALKNEFKLMNLYKRPGQITDSI